MTSDKMIQSETREEKTKRPSLQINLFVFEERQCGRGGTCISLHGVFEVFGDKNGNGLINRQLDAENTAALFSSQQFSADSNTGLWARSGLLMKMCVPTKS